MKSPRPANKTRQFSTSVHRKRKKSRQKATFFTILPVFCITKFQHFHPNIRFLRNIALQFQSNPPKQRCRAMQNAPIKACELWQSSAQQRRLFPHILHHPAQGASADRENTPEAAPTQAPTPSHPAGKSPSNRFPSAPEGGLSSLAPNAPTPDKSPPILPTNDGKASASPSAKFPRRAVRLACFCPAQEQRAPPATQAGIRLQYPANLPRRHPQV